MYFKEGMRRMDLKSLFAGIFTGSLASSLIILFTTPASGPAVRHSIKHSEWNRPGLKSSTNKSAMEDWQYAATEGFQAFDVLTKEMKKTYKRYKQEVEPEVASIQEQVKEISDSISQLNKQIKKETRRS
jgi:gas vesicle protein